MRFNKFYIISACVACVSVAAWKIRPNRLEVAGGVNVFQAIDKDDISGIREYVKAGGDVSTARHSYESPLLYAMSKDKKASFAALLEQGADPNLLYWQIDLFAFSVVHYAAGNPDPYWLKLALEHGGDANISTKSPTAWRRNSPLSLVLNSGSTDCVVELLDHGADPNHVDAEAGSVLYQACMHSRFDACVLLLQRGANVPLKKNTDDPYCVLSNLEQKKPGIFVNKKIKDDRIELGKWLRERGADLSE